MRNRIDVLFNHWSWYFMNLPGRSLLESMAEVF